MVEVEERTVGELTVRIDRSLCVGFGHCIEESPDAFKLDESDDLVAFEDPERADRERLLRACEVCPVEALSVFDADGNQLVP
ncbi:MAG: ferredoxin [Acidimicrobiales bacterium]